MRPYSPKQSAMNCLQLPTYVDKVKNIKKLWSDNSHSEEVGELIDGIAILKNWKLICAEYCKRTNFRTRLIFVNFVNSTRLRKFVFTNDVCIPVRICWYVIGGRSKCTKFSISEQGNIVMYQISRRPYENSWCSRWSDQAILQACVDCYNVDVKHYQQDHRAVLLLSMLREVVLVFRCISIIVLKQPSCKHPVQQTIWHEPKWVHRILNDMFLNVSQV